VNELITKLVPILHVVDADAERRFYQQLGLRTTYEGPEYPGFLAVGNDRVEFGLSERADADPASAGFTWQLGVSDFEAAMAACAAAGLDYRVEVEHPRPDWSYRVLTVTSPNGFAVQLEEQSG
jgi:catechol-2,3-dioxygenase